MLIRYKNNLIFCASIGIFFKSNYLYLENYLRLLYIHKIYGGNYLEMYIQNQKPLPLLQST